MDCSLKVNNWAFLSSSNSVVSNFGIFYLFLMLGVYLSRFPDLISPQPPSTQTEGFLMVFKVAKVC